jgi:inosine-uridine nucleoside N-ribohydrolase
MIPVLLDTDIGTDIDDTWALAMLIGCPELDLRLVTTVSGDTTYRAAITAGILAAGDRGDVPIAIGVPGDGGFGTPQAAFAADVDLGVYPGGVSFDAAGAIVEAVMASSDVVTVLSIGPTTNIAAALTAEPTIAERARFVGMHGSIRVGNGVRGAPDAEYNVRADVPSFRKVIAARWPVTITPLDTCGSVVLTGKRYAAARSAGTPLLGALLRNQREWLDAVGQRNLLEQRTTTLFDTVGVYLAYSEEFLEIEELAIVVEDDGTLRVDPAGSHLRAATRWLDSEAFADHLIERLLGR